MPARRHATYPWLLTAIGLGCSTGDSRAPSAGVADATADSSPAESGGDDAMESGSDAVGGEEGTLTTEAAAEHEAAAPFLRTVFLLVMENKNLIQLKGNPAAPFVNSLFLSAASAQQYYNPPRNHPSEPNYVWLEAGDSLGIPDDNDPAINARDTPDHLVAYLQRAGISWKAYQEDISGTDCPLTPVALYGPKHNPFVFFKDVTGKNNPADPFCIQHIRPFSEFAADLKNYTVARYNFITPNLCNDMHSCATQIGDAWMQSTVSMILASPAYLDGGVLFIAWDEADGGDGPIGLFALSPIAKAGYSNTTTYYDHSSLLKTLQEIFGVTPLLRHAGDPGVNDLSDLFSSFP
ncbi:MAG: alkaline phosphatase family protein [Myxococcota bacterium]|nr:alkaline phosphatase family protein [Myxococcota bacterium]